MDYNQAQDAITKAVGIMSLDDRGSLIALLQKNGSLVANDSTQEELLDAAFKAIKNSPRFRNDLQSYLSAAVQSEANYGNFTDDSAYSNVVEPKKQTKVGSFLSSVFTSENISKIVGTGIGVLGTKLQSNANKSSEQRAIDYQVAVAQAEAAKIAAAAAVPPAKEKPKWVLPVAIVGGLLVIGTIVYFVARKK
jgi:cobalamin biosynthesis Mg chelatase CobN